MFILCCDIFSLHRSAEVKRKTDIVQKAFSKSNTVKDVNNGKLMADRLKDFRAGPPQNQHMRGSVTSHHGQRRIGYPSFPSFSDSRTVFPHSQLYYHDEQSHRRCDAFNNLSASFYESQSVHTNARGRYYHDEQSQMSHNNYAKVPASFYDSRSVHTNFSWYILSW